MWKDLGRAAEGTCRRSWEKRCVYIRVCVCVCTSYVKIGGSGLSVSGVELMK